MKELKVALVCIACNEDHYIKEWINYHKLIGVDEIFIYQNNWRYPFEDNDEWLHLIEWDGKVKQLAAYNDFKDHHYEDFDFGIFIDCDEFICLKKHNDIKEFLNEYLDYNGIGLNWKNFGDSHLDFTGDYSLISRFILAQKGLHGNYKTIVNFNKLKNKFVFSSANHINLCDMIISIDKSHFLNGSFDNGSKENYVIQLNHYRKTRREFYDRRKNGPPDAKISQQQINEQYKQFDIEFIHYNEEEDLHIQKYMMSHFNSLDPNEIILNKK